MKREITITPAFDKRDSDPSRNYGIHGCDMRFYLTGEKGVIQFVLSTNWHLPHVHEELAGRRAGWLCKPMPVDLGYHSSVPMYEGQSLLTECCEVLGGRPCYYDGSTLNAESIYEIMLREGSEGVWRELERYYEQTFGEPCK